MDISKLKVGTRLSLGFGAVVILLLITAVLGATKLAQLNAATSLVADNKLPKVQQAYTLVTQVDRISIALRDMMLSPSEAPRHGESVLAARKMTKAALEELQRTVVSPEGVALLKTVAENRARFVDAQNIILGHAQAGRMDDAQAFLTGEMRQIQDTYKESLAVLIKHEADDAAAAGRDAAATYGSARIWLLGLGALAVALAVAIGLAITRSLLKQLGGEPAYAAHVAKEIAAGNLGVEVRVQANDNASLLHAMAAMREQLAAVVREVRAGTDMINTAAGEIAAGNQELSARTEQEASSLEETASSLEELTQTVRENAANARQANELAASATDNARLGGSVVAQVVERMDAINASSHSIVEIISVIDGIAFQTNILALNAAVEAARAGEQGRGFAVVASEVRTLAQRSAAAAKQIKQLIDNSVDQVDAGAKLVDQAGMTMSTIIDSVRRVADIMAEITSASAEQSDGLDQINQAVAQMDQVTQQNAALVEEAAAASAAMSEQAASLANTVRVFKLDGAGRGAPAPASNPRLGLAAPQLTAY